MTNQKRDCLEPEPSYTFADINSVDGIPLGKGMTRARWSAIQEALVKFGDAVKEAGQATEATVQNPHCMAIVGHLGYTQRDKKKSTEDRVADSCGRHFEEYPSEARERTIHVVLNSEGGSLDSAFKTVLFLRRFANDLKVYVPRRAKSAATLIAIGADEIQMSPYAELGPLDSQVDDPRNPTRTVSALDLYQSVDYVREFGLQTLPRALRVLHLHTQDRIPLPQLLTTAVDFSLRGVVPVLEQVKALDFGSWGRNLKIGETYAKSLLGRLSNESLKGAAADRIAKRLVYEYTHHPYPIDIDEARQLGLVNTVVMHVNVYHAAMQVLEECEDLRFVGFAGEEFVGEEKDRPELADKSHQPPPVAINRPQATPRVNGEAGQSRTRTEEQPPARPEGN